MRGMTTCAFAQRSRCETCAGTCEAVTDSDATTECARLAEDNGRGYYLLCINLALAITSVETCAIDRAASCPRNVNAAESLAALENNAAFLDDAACSQPLDSCLAQIYGAPPEEFPNLDGGVTPPREPRSTSVDCGDGCSSSNNANCDFSPSCDCSGPSCNNSLSCDSTCSDSGADCSSCDGCDSSSSSGCSGGGCSNSCGGSSCSTTKRDDSGGGFALILSLAWAFAPVPIALRVRRKAVAR